ncbi:hypothetical protein [Embleya scabrispora]|nr:hypothetical protein [Embleya scabrispora]
MSPHSAAGRGRGPGANGRAAYDEPGRVTGSPGFGSHRETEFM